MWHNAKLGEPGTGAGLEPAPTDLRHSVLYQPITPQIRYNQIFFCTSGCTCASVRMNSHLQVNPLVYIEFGLPLWALHILHIF
jgi:hypothetical protein